MSETSLLKDPLIFPSNEVLQNALGKIYSTYAELVKRLQDLNIETEWRFYNDGKEWLGKNTHKKKTIFWLSIWNGCFKLSFYFNDKNMMGVKELPIDDELKVFYNRLVK
jgi:hypothetical protein